MKEKIKIPIKDVILKKDNIIGLAKCILNQEDIRKICFNIKFINEQEIESDDILVFENEKFNEFEIKSIHMSYLDTNYTKNIEIYIYNYQQHSGNSYVEISYESKDGLDWLAITEKNIKDQILYCDKRNRIISLLQNDTVLFVAILIVNIFVAIFFGRITGRIINSNKENLSLLILCVFGFLECISICWRNIFYQAFPIIEIDIKEKNNSSKRARKMIKFILFTFILPFLLDIAFNVIEKTIGIN